MNRSASPPDVRRGCATPTAGLSGNGLAPGSGLYLRASDRLRPNQTVRRGRAIRAWFAETVAEQVRHADFLLQPEQLRGRLSPYPQAWVSAEVLRQGVDHVVTISRS